MLKLEDNFFC